MAYITKSNSKKILRSLDLEKLDEIEEKVYKKDIYFFNKKERGFLKGIRELLRDAENFQLEYYEPIEVHDSYRFVYPEKQPAYHLYNTCPMLTADFNNFKIPVPIKEKGKEAINQFREWFPKNEPLLIEGKTEQFIYKLQANFPYVGEIKPESIEYSNSGIEEKENIELSELEKKIDDILRQAGKFFRENKDKQNVIKRYQKMTFLAYIEQDLYTNDSDLSDDKLKEFLQTYDKKFKQPVKDLLIEYYRVLYNPEMTFDGKLLDELGFNPCIKCYGRRSDEDIIVETI